VLTEIEVTWDVMLSPPTNSHFCFEEHKCLLWKAPGIQRQRIAREDCSLQTTHC